MAKRVFDILFVTVGILLLSPLLLGFAIWIRLKDGSPVLFRQERIGLHGHPFRLFKFRTMHLNAESKGQLSIGKRDPRVTDIGQFLRRTKMDELPQLFNILKGDMSLVGPRPEVQRYVALYSDEQREVLNVRPGLTDAASLAFFNESEVLAQAEDPERYYIEEIMPTKLRYNLDYLEERSLLKDLGIIMKTLKRILG